MSFLDLRTVSLNILTQMPQTLYAMHLNGKMVCESQVTIQTVTLVPQ